MEGEARREDELRGGIVDERVFQAGGQVEEAVRIAERVVVHVKVAVLRGDEGQAVGDGPAHLHRIELRGAAAEEVVVDRVMHKDRADLGADLRVLKEDRVCHRGDGVILPGGGLDAGIRGRRGMGGGDE